MRLETFDDFNSTEFQQPENQFPFQYREEKSNKEATLKWLVSNFNTMEIRSQSKMNTWRRYWAYYKGIQWRDRYNRNQFDDNQSTNMMDKKPKMVTNFIWEMVEGRVAQMAINKPSIVCIPNNANEQSDINNAKACKKLLDSRADVIDIEKIMEEADRIKFITGTVFQKVCWDPDDGPIKVGMEEFIKDGKVDEIGEDGLPTGKKIKASIHVGDVIVENLGPDSVFVEMDKEKWEDVDHVDIVKWEHVEAVKAEYPALKDKILANNRFRWDIEAHEIAQPTYMVQVRHFYHKKTKALPEGAYIIYTDDVILYQGPNPYKHGGIPLVIDKDIEIHREIYGRSFISNIEQMQRFYNNIQSGMARDVGVGMMPKWMVPKGSAKIQSLNNEFTVVEFSGPVAPQLIQNVPISEKLLNLQDRLESKIGKHSTIYDISRGEVPQGVTANSALRFLDEQESRRVAPLIRARRARVRNVFKMMSQVMAQFYQEDDGRTMRILGRNNEYLIESIKKADFTQVYDIKLQNSSAMPDTKTGKISTIVDLNISTQTDPIFNKKEIIKMLDLGMDESFVDQATVAVDAANTILEMMMDGKEVPEPQPYDDLLVHWSIFSKAIQTVSFKTKLNPAIVDQIKTRILTMEVLIYEKCKWNVKFCSDAMILDLYPMFYHIPQPLVEIMKVLQAPPQQAQPAQPTGFNAQGVKNMQNQQGEMNVNLES